MPRQYRYRTGILVRPSGEYFAPPPPYHGATWSFVLARLDASANPSVGSLVEFQQTFKPRRASHRELCVRATDWYTASIALGLYHRAEAMLRGDILTKQMFGHAVVPVAVPKRADDLSLLSHDEREYVHANAGLRREGIDQLLPAYLAARFSNDQRAEYGLHRLYQSLDIFSRSIMDFHPEYGDRPASRREPDRASQVLFGTAIVSAYGALEDLGVSVPPAKSCHVINPNAAKPPDWNPDTLAELKRCLVKRGISPDAKVLWLMRGQRRDIDVFRRVSQAGTKATWSDPVLDLHDEEVPMPDAINQLAWLRNKVGAHGMSHQSRQLTSVDVHNAQQVARQALMLAMGTWRLEDDRAPIGVDRRALPRKRRKDT